MGKILATSEEALKKPLVKIAGGRSGRKKGKEAKRQ